MIILIIIVIIIMSVVLLSSRVLRLSDLGSILLFFVKRLSKRPAVGEEHALRLE